MEPPRIPEYRLELDVDFDRSRWHGQVAFDLTSGSAPFDLDIDGLTVTRMLAGDRDIPLDGNRRANALGLPELPPSSKVTVEFDGVVPPSGLIGLYRCRHADGQVLTTQCEPVGARRIFPCIDRPDRKARIRLTVRTRGDLEVISNTSPETVHASGGQREWRFAPTPPMAPYLFYLGIGRFDRAEESTGRVAIRVLTPPGRSASGAYGARAASRILQACEDYYGIPYPLPKLDLIAVSDHAFGAMENWGAISFRDMRLLVDLNANSFARRDVFETTAHEIAHQWFGNLVTMVSWDDIWLNESFASFMETRISEQLEPALDCRADFFLRVAGTTAAFDGDSLPSTHPVRAKVDRPDEISQIFDEISYGKGSSVLAMLEGYLGEDRFRAGVAAYLNRFCYGNARTDDLWAALANVSHEPVASLVGPWVDRPGHPVIHASVGPKGLRLRQQRFSYLGAHDEPPWPIPLVLDVDGTRRRLLLRDRESDIETPKNATVHLNPGAVGFYRVHYDPTLYSRLLPGLPQRSAADRWSVASDLAAFVLSGDEDWATFREFVRAVGATHDRLVVESLTGSLSTFATAFSAHREIQEEAVRYFRERIDALGLDKQPGQPEVLGIVRERLSGARVRHDLDFARELAPRFARWPTVDPDLRSAVAIAYGRTGGAGAWTDMRRMLERPLGEAEGLQLERGLAWTDDPKLLETTLGLTLSGGVALGHVRQLILSVTSNPAGREIVWPWLQEHLPSLDERLRGSGDLSRIFEVVIPLLGLDRADAVRSYFGQAQYPEGTRGIAKGLGRLDVLERVSRRWTAG